MNAPCRPQRELDLHGHKWKDNTAVVSTVEHASVEQCGHITANGLDIPTDAAGGFTDGNGASPTQCLQQFAALFGEYLPEQFWRGEADARGLSGFARFPCLSAVRHRVGRRTDVKCHCFRHSTSQCRAGSRQAVGRGSWRCSRSRFDRKVGGRLCQRRCRGARHARHGQRRDPSRARRVVGMWGPATSP